jgi:SAM-dependent methyltransferase
MSAVTNYSGSRLLTTAVRQQLTLPQMTQPQRALLQPSDITTIGVTAYRDMLIEYVAVPDITDGADHHAARKAMQDEIARMNDELETHSHWPAPALDPEKRLQPNNPVAAAMYDSAPCLKMWRERLVPTAIALTSLYEPESWTLPTGEPIDTRTRSFFMHSLDAIAIRSRAAIMSDFARRYATSDGSVTRWTSIACGAAIPVLDAVEKHVGTAAVHLKLIDFDPNALDHARDKAVDRGLVEAEHFELLKRNVVKDLIVSDNLVRELGAESQQFVDMLGIFEYIADEFDGFKSAAALLANAFQLVKPGGALVAANMLDTRPGLHFIQRGLGWPRLFPRSIDQIYGIITDAGIDPASVTMTIAGDGLYAVFEISKPDALD